MKGKGFRGCDPPVARLAGRSYLYIFARPMGPRVTVGTRVLSKITLLKITGDTARRGWPGRRCPRLVIGIAATHAYRGRPWLSAGAGMTVRLTMNSRIFRPGPGPYLWCFLWAPRLFVSWHDGAWLGLGIAAPITCRDRHLRPLAPVPGLRRLPVACSTDTMQATRTWLRQLGSSLASSVTGKRLPISVTTAHRPNAVPVSRCHRHPTPSLLYLPAPSEKQLLPAFTQPRSSDCAEAFFGNASCLLLRLSILEHQTSSEPAAGKGSPA